MWRRKLERMEPRRQPDPPKRIRHSARSPSACQKVTSRQPKSGGNSQFHSSRTIWPPMAMKTNIPRIASGAIQISLFNLGLMFGPSCLREFVVDPLQPPAQMQHRVAFAGEQRVHAHAGRGGHLLEAASFELVRDKHLALIFWQLADRELERIEKHVAGVER